MIKSNYPKYQTFDADKSSSDATNGEQALFVVGMHRSGTSCLTGCLEDAGFFLGDVSRKNPHNLKGNNENLDVMHLNDAVLGYNCASWDTPPAGLVEWSPEHRAERDRILARYRGQVRFAIKDPRLLLTIDGWLEALPDARIAGTFRHPQAVAASLSAREQISLVRSNELWLTYNKRLLDLCTLRDVTLVCFDWSDEQYKAALVELLRRLDLSPPTNGFPFFEAALRRNAAPTEPPIKPHLKTVWQALLDRAVSNID